MRQSRVRCFLQSAGQQVRRGFKESKFGLRLGIINLVMSCDSLDIHTIYIYERWLGISLLAPAAEHQYLSGISLADDFLNLTAVPNSSLLLNCHVNDRAVLEVITMLSLDT